MLTTAQAVNPVGAFRDADSQRLIASFVRNDLDGLYYDYVLVHGRVDPFARPLPGPRWLPLSREGDWALYEKAR